MYKNLISSFILSFTIFCFVNVEAGVVFGIFILRNLELDSVWDIDYWNRY